MNFLDQFSNYSSIVSLNFLSSPKNQPKCSLETKSSPRHSSLHRMDFNADASKKKGEDRNSKSIDKLILPRFNEQKEAKNIVLHKFARRIKNKIRKLQFEFWVSFENQSKANLTRELKFKQKLQEHGSRYCQGLQKMAIFINSFQDKYAYNFGMSKAVQRLKNHEINARVFSTIQSSLQKSINTSCIHFFEQIKKSQNQSLKIEMLVESVSINCLKRILQTSFHAIQNYKNEDFKQKQENQINVCAPIKIQYLPQCLKHKFSFEQGFDGLSENLEKKVEIPCKQKQPELVQNFPDQCDSNIIFIQKLPSDGCESEEERKSYFTPRESTRNAEILESARKGTLRQEDALKVKINFNDLHIGRTRKSMTNFGNKLWSNGLENSENKEGYVVSGKKQKLRINKAISTFNHFDSKIEGLQNKLFRESKYDKYSGNWKNDRETINKIMESLNNTPTKREEKNKNYRAGQYEDYLIQDFGAKAVNSEIPSQKSGSTNNLTIDVDNYMKEERKTDLGNQNRGKKPQRLSVTSAHPKQAEEQKQSKVLISLKNRRKQTLDSCIEKFEQISSDLRNPKQIRMFKPSDWKKLYLKEKVV